jgi:hypothetical protein
MIVVEYSKNTEGGKYIFCSGLLAQSKVSLWLLVYHLFKCRLGICQIFGAPKSQDLFISPTTLDKLNNTNIAMLQSNYVSKCKLKYTFSMLANPWLILSMCISMNRPKKYLNRGPKH